MTNAHSLLQLRARKPSRRRLPHSFGGLDQEPLMRSRSAFAWMVRNGNRDNASRIIRELIDQAREASK
ncbi:MAG TPA: hypothetical protein DIW77_16905 [Chromatiaceae bacterium]|nr:MAG: hypothetical protein N838_19775 [Thiohalocapsa sp. PB-PSB1]HCS91671.1 hypothetical protein [Chromatiaceae bacterium]